MVRCNCTGMAESLFSSHKEDYPDVEHASLCQLFQHKVGWSLGRCNLFSLNKCDCPNPLCAPIGLHIQVSIFGIYCEVVFHVHV